MPRTRIAGWQPFPPLRPGPLQPDTCTERDHAPTSLLFPAFRLRTASLALSAVVLTGCMSLAPAPDTPPLPCPKPGLRILDQHRRRPRGRTCLAGVLHRPPLLQRLIETALENNRDLRLAALRRGSQRRIPHSALGSISCRGRGCPRWTRPRPWRPEHVGPVAGGRRISGRGGFEHLGAGSVGRVRNLEDAALQSWLASDAAPGPSTWR